MATKPLTTSQAAERLSVTYGRVCQLCQAGLIRATKAGRDWRIAPGDLDRYVEAIRAARSGADSPIRGRREAFLHEVQQSVTPCSAL